MKSIKLFWGLKNIKYLYEFTEKERKQLNRLATEKMKLKLLSDIKMNLIICEIENWDKTEYINELKELIKLL